MTGDATIAPATGASVTATFFDAGTYVVTATVSDGMATAKADVQVTVAPCGTRVYVADANGDNKVDIADAVYILSYLFAGGPAPRCMKAGDANDDNKIDIADAISALSYLFAQGSMKAPDGSALNSSNPPSCATYKASDIPATMDGKPGCATQCTR